jgi:hypothetical protein
MLRDWLGSLSGRAACLSVHDAALHAAPAVAAALSPPPARLDSLLLGHVACPAADALVDTMLTYEVTYDLATGGTKPWQTVVGDGRDPGTHPPAVLNIISLWNALEKPMGLRGHMVAHGLMAYAFGIGLATIALCGSLLT